MKSNNSPPKDTRIFMKKVCGLNDLKRFYTTLNKVILKWYRFLRVSLKFLCFKVWKDRVRSNRVRAHASRFSAAQDIYLAQKQRRS